MFETLRKSGAIDAVARKLGLPLPVAATAARQLLPQLVDAFRERSAQAGGGEAGLRDLVEMLSVLGGGQLASHVLSADAPEPRAGEALLVQLFGSVSQSHAKVDGAQTGLDPELAHQMQAFLAMAVGGYLAARLRGLDLAERGQVAIDDLLEPGES